MSATTACAWGWMGYELTPAYDVAHTAKPGLRYVKLRESSLENALTSREFGIQRAFGPWSRSSRSPAEWCTVGKSILCNRGYVVLT